MDPLDPSAIHNLPYPPLAPETPPKPSRKRKHSTNTLSEDDLGQNGSSRKSRPPGTKRACNQCRQQKLKCNVIEDPWKDCDRCKKHNLKCEITADFKRIGKRSQQAELEKNNMLLAQTVEELKRQLASTRDGSTDFDVYSQLQRHHIDRDLLGPSRPPSILPDADDSHDAALLLNLKQGNDMSPAGPHRKLGEVYFAGEKIHKLWEEYLSNYHPFLPLLDPEKEAPELLFEKSEILFWTVILIASRHFSEDQGLLTRIIPPYTELLNQTVCKPPSGHHTVKALCLICTWPLPVSSTTSDMTLVWSGVMMKFAMQLGLHRPSYPMDFSNTRVQLREEDITDRFKTWVTCNIVAQNVSTGYGQPPDTVYDATLQTTELNAPEGLHARLEIEKVVDRITRSVWSPREANSANFGDSSNFVEAEMMSSVLQSLESTVDTSNPLNQLYANACALHLRLFVFFEEPTSPSYRMALTELYDSAKNFIGSAFLVGIELRHAPNYIQQMLLAAAVTLLRLLNSFFAAYVNRDTDQNLFWDAITTLRSMSVKSNDLPLRLAEVFAQMWQADAEKLAEQELTDGEASNGDVEATLTLKRRYRMSMSHVFDSIWRWRDELQGKVRAEKLEAAIKDPTSPLVSAHRGSFSNGRPPSALLDDPNNAFSGMTSFSGFGGMPLAPSNDLLVANSVDAFDSLGWYLDSNWGEMPYP